MSALRAATAGTVGTGRVAAGPPPSDDPRSALLTTQLKKVRYRADALIEVLHAVQDIYGFLSPGVLETVADALELPPSRVLGVATFYHLFTFEARGDHTCTVCTGTACFVKGADALLASVSDTFEVPKGGTRDDRSLSLLEARCIGSCGLAPAALVDGAMVAKATPERLVGVIRSAMEAAPAADPGEPESAAGGVA